MRNIKLKMRKLPLMLIASVFLAVSLLAFGNGQISETSSGSDFSSSAQYYQPGFNSLYSSEEISTYWPILGKEDCRARQDFILSIAPGGCQPAVVRSDLLEEQNVPVFCKINAVKLNPLIDIEAIESMSFRGKYPDGVTGVGFHPARAAIRSYNTLLGSPLVNDVGYLVVVLKRQQSEKTMPEFVAGNLTARIRYDIEKAFGVGRAEFILPVLTDREWENNYQDYGFWRGKGFLRAEMIDSDRVSISVYRDATHRESSTILTKGKTSDDIYLGGFYCQAALQLHLSGVVTPQTRVKLVVSKEGEENTLWLYENSKLLDNKCRITSLEPISLGGGSVGIKCGREEFTLGLGAANNLNLEINGEEQSVKLWEPISSFAYPAYVGEVPRALEKIEEKRAFVVILQADKDLAASDQELIQDKIRYALDREKRAKDKKSFETNAESRIKSSLQNKGVTNVNLIFYGSDEAIKFLGVAESEDEDLEVTSDKIVDEYFEKAIDEYTKTVQLYPIEKTKQESSETIGELALDSGIKLAGALGKQTTKQALLRDVVNNYPSTNMADDAQKQLAKTLSYDEEDSVKTIKVGLEYYTFQIQDIVEPGIDEASAVISVDGKDAGTYGIGDYLSTDSSGENEFIQLYGLEDEYAIIRYSTTTRYSSAATTKTEKVKLKEFSTLGKFSIYISDIKLNKAANVVVEPKIIGPYTETNLSFKIGIEKRAIELSPQKTKSKIQNLNKSIDDWQKISDKLKNVVKGWKGACYATSAVLLIKNLVDNFSGKSMARQKVMRGADGSSGWINKCKEMMSNGEKGYLSLDQCLYGERDSIEKEVNAAQKSIDSTNQIIKSTEVIKEETIFGEKILDTEHSFEGFMGEFKNSAKGKVFYKYENGEKTTQTFTMGDLIGEYQKAYEDGVYTFSDAREWMFDAEMANNPDVSEDTRKSYAVKLSDEFKRISDRKDTILKSSDYTDAIQKSGVGDGAEILGDGKERYTSNIFDLKSQTAGTFKGLDYTSYKQTKGADEIPTSWIRVVVPSGTGISKDVDKDGKIGDNEKDESYAGKILLVPLSQQEGKYFHSSGMPAYILEADKDSAGAILGEKVTGTVASSDAELLFDKLGVSSFERIEKGKCNNPYKNPQVRFNEVEPYKGLPGVIPLDIREGWYVATKQTLKGFGLTPYTDAGVLKNFYLCNVGKDGREDFESGLRDDVCTLISLETGASINHPCLTETEARKLVEKAREGVMEAARQYASGVKKIRVFGETFDVGVPVGGAEGTQCQDFMSPEDCYLLFNTCDPVLCPASRCNLGGSYNVQDVVQSGIIGSIALCLPNAREGIIVPVCLTGVQAGIDAYLSILKNHRDCLQENLDSGKMIGICDEIYSVYVCEFFWRQFAPLMDVFIPKMIELAYGQGTRGGGEYATVTHAWNTLDNSMNYFTQYYAQNAYNAFKIRSTEEAGTEVCKSFISARYPAGKDFFDNLLEPESPAQYHAWFSETPFTEATIPATSHYKVFYHIWAGKDQGAQYTVFLKDPPEMSYYASSPRIFVETGYINKGGYASQTKDFTAPAGYKTLCVRVNLQEECGFGQVSTSFAVDYLGEQYVKDQATQEVITEKECVSGTPSIYSIAQPNIEEAAQGVIQPDMYKKGIIRICSTDNPGKQTDPNRWKDVGYCGEQKLRCWLDMNSVEDNIKNNQTLTEVEKAVGDIDSKKREEMIETGEILAEDDSESKLERAIIEKNSIDAITNEIPAGNAEEFAKQLEKKYEASLSELEDVEDRGFYNSQKAQAIFLKGQIYDAITRKIKDFVDKSKQVVSSVPAATTAETGTTSYEERLIVSTLQAGDVIAKEGVWYRILESKQVEADWALSLLNIDTNEKTILKKSKDSDISKEGYSLIQE